MAPFVWGGAEELAVHLVRNLTCSGAEAGVFRIPFSWEPPERLVDEMLIARRLRLTNVDRVIALKFPAYLVPWPNKVIWLLHQYRQAYDLRDAGQSNIPETDRGHEILSAIRRADDISFAEAKTLYTISPETSRRLRHYNARESVVLRQPLNDPEYFIGGESGDYIVATGRVNSAKRQDLLVRALRHAPGVRLVIAGPPDSKEVGDDLRRLVATEGVKDRVTLELRMLERGELAKLVNGARAVAYLPFNEDSLSYCAMEACHAAKPVITTVDAGGILDLIQDRDTGIVASPEPQTLGEALVRLWESPSLAIRLGAAGRDRLADMELNWPQTVEKLLS
jgi:glycosyltransferase involved in cell wall biosynthesis